MGNCASEHRAFGVKLDVLQELALTASANLEVAAPTTSMPEPEPSSLFGGFFSRKSAEPDQERSYESRVTMDIVATSVVRPITHETKKAYVFSLLKDPVSVSSNAGLADVLLAIGENSPVDKVIQVLKSLNMPPGTYYYNDELSSLDMLAPFNDKDALGLSREDHREVSVTPRRQSTRSARPSTRTPDPSAPDELDKGGKPTISTVQRRQIAHYSKLRAEYWSEEFPEAAEQCSRAIFVLDGLNDYSFCHASRDLQWLYALHCAASTRRPTKIQFVIPPSELDDFGRLMLDQTSRGLFLKAVRAASFDLARARSISEDQALRAAIDPVIDKAQAEVTRLFTEWVCGEATRIVAERLQTIGKAGDDEREDVFELWKVKVALQLELKRPDEAENEANQLYATAKEWFGANDPKTLDAYNMLANLYRRRGGVANIDKAIAIYVEILGGNAQGTSAVSHMVTGTADAVGTMVAGTEGIFESMATWARPKASGSHPAGHAAGHAASPQAGSGLAVARAEKIAGAHMQIANSLRDKGQLGEAEPHYRAALHVSIVGLGHDNLNTHYCQISLANCLRTRVLESFPSAEALERARAAKLAARTGEAEAAFAKVEAARNQALALLTELEILYRNANVGLAKMYGSLDNVMVAARLNHACVLLELGETNDLFVMEARVIFEELLVETAGSYGPKHEASLYVQAKLGVLKLCYDLALRDRTEGKRMVQESLHAMLSELKLGEKHPRVLEIKSAMPNVPRIAQRQQAAVQGRLANRDRSDAPRGSKLQKRATHARLDVA